MNPFQSTDKEAVDAFARSMIRKAVRHNCHILSKRKQCKSFDQECPWSTPVAFIKP